LVEVRDGGAGGLTGQAAGLEADGAGAELAVVNDGFGGRDLGSLHGAPSFVVVARRPAAFDRGPRTTGEPVFRGPLPKAGWVRPARWWCVELSSAVTGGHCKDGPDPYGSEPARVSATQSEAPDQGAVPLDVDTLQVLEQVAALTDEQQQTTT